MFTISAKADYGLIIMLELAKNYGQGYLAMANISATRSLSLHYLTQITKPLREANLLKSKEGKTGGYTLTKKPEQITILEILEALEGKVTLPRCSCNIDDCAGFSGCEVKIIWPFIMKDVRDLLKTKTLGDLLREANQKK